MLIKRLSNAIVKYRYSKEILDFAKPNPIKQQLTQHSLNCLVLHPILHPNQSPQLELYMAEEAISLSKSLNWTLQKGPIWKDEQIKDINNNEGEHNKIEDEQNDKQQHRDQDDFDQEWRNQIYKNSIAQSSLIKVSNIESTTFFNTEQLTILGQHIQSKQINAVFINYELTPIQSRNLEKLWTYYIKGELTTKIEEEINNIYQNKFIEDKFNAYVDDLSIKVFDRFKLILLIFAKRYTQGISKLQFELSFLKFAKIQLMDSINAFLSFLSIFKADLLMANQIYTEVLQAYQRNTDETLNRFKEDQLQIQSKFIDNRITQIQKLIEDDTLQSSTIRRKKLIHNIPSIALIGYTNVGKSSVLNCILQKDEIADINSFFQSLDTSKQIRLVSGQKAIILNTLGFISDLPHNLVETFKSTLKKVEEADIVLHIRDISHPCTEQQKQIVLNVLKELGFKQEFYNKKMIEIWNKIDLMNQPIDYELIESQDYPIVPICAQMNINIKKLIQVMEEKSNEIMNKKLYRLRYNIDQHFERLKWLYDNGNISGVKNELQFLPVKRGDPTIIEYDVILDEVAYSRYMATFQPEMKILKKSMPSSNRK